MSEQIKDTFLWKDEEWVFLGAEDIDSLFDPKYYGLSPTSFRTDCWKGFVIQFAVRNRRLILDELWIYCENGVYPKINGAAAKNSAPFWACACMVMLKILRFCRKNAVGLNGGVRCYKNIGERLHYSGAVIVGQQFKEEYSELAFTTPDMYERVYQLDFQDGMLLSCCDISDVHTGAGSF